MYFYVSFFILLLLLLLLLSLFGSCSCTLLLSCKGLARKRVVRNREDCSWPTENCRKKRKKKKKEKRKNESKACYVVISCRVFVSTLSSYDQFLSPFSEGNYHVWLVNKVKDYALVAKGGVNGTFMCLVE